jgi:predicted choloylglycine hydrolase
MAKEGSFITGGTLDDPRWLYAFCEVRPKEGYRYMSFPIAGTCWGNRGMNEAGLVLNTSSNMFQGVRFDPFKIYQQDLAVRVILQNCKNINEVRSFCETYPFQLNLIVVDRDGGCLVMGVWDRGPTIYSEGTGCLTDHPIDEQLKQAIDRGYDESSCVPCSITRFNQLSQWTRNVEGKATIEEAKRMLSCRKHFFTGGVNNSGTIFSTIAQPQKNPKVLWVAETPVTIKRFKKYCF